MSTDFRDRPSMLDAFGTRIPLYPAKASGAWRRRRTIVHGILLVFFLILPWLEWNDRPLVLFDLSHGRFHLFGLSFMAHDGPMIFFVLGIVAISLALITALWGRAWCGWACPQTVFLDGVIRRLEHWIEGSHLQRRTLDQGPWNTGKIFKKSLKWASFILFCLILTHTLLAYFFGTDQVLEMIRHDPRQHPGPFLFVFFLTGLILFDMAWFREQFCLIVCPYGRIQTVLMDRHTVSVQYDSPRGEPRGKLKGGAIQSGNGACVDCNRCVSVCPTGIDIRNGVQLECIACTACIDACDDVMLKTRQEPGLIRHATQSLQPVKWLRPRVLLYTGILIAMIIALAISLSHHRQVDITVLRGLGAPFIERLDENGHALVANDYRLRVNNRLGEDVDLQVELVKAPYQGFHLIVPTPLLHLRKDDSKTIPISIQIPKSFLPGKGGSVKLVLSVQGRPHEVDFVLP